MSLYKRRLSREKRLYLVIKVSKRMNADIVNEMQLKREYIWGRTVLEIFHQLLSQSKSLV